MALLEIDKYIFKYVFLSTFIFHSGICGLDTDSIANHGLQQEQVNHSKHRAQNKTLRLQGTLFHCCLAAGPWSDHLTFSFLLMPGTCLYRIHSEKQFERWSVCLFQKQLTKDDDTLPVQKMLYGTESSSHKLAWPQIFFVYIT